MGESIDIRKDMPKKADYSSMVVDLESRLARMGGIRSSFLYGSFARGDDVPGWSDLDVMVVMGSLDLPMYQMESLHKIGTEIARRHPISMTFKIHTKDEIPDYDVADGSIHPYFLRTYADSGIRLTGESPSELLAPLLQEFDIQSYREFLIQRIYVERHKLRSSLSSINEHSPFDFSIHLPLSYFAQIKQIGTILKAAKVIDSVLDVCMYANGIRGNYTMHKDEICNVFREEFGGEIDTKVPFEANAIRKQWGLFDIQHIESFLRKGYDFVNDAYGMVR